jgi:tRNA pseudouridine38-40 synthase
MRFVACIVAYDGGPFCGSQRQANGRTVQGEIERALEGVLRQPTPITMAGRTDAGVHATGQCFRFEMEHRIPVERVPLALNTKLERAIRVLQAREVDASFHPRFSARSRAYRYLIDNAEIGNPLLRGMAAHVPGRLNVAAMRRAAGPLLGRQDFAAWQSAGSPTPTTVREVKRLEIRRRVNFGSPLLEIEMEADAFLYQMVRNMVGALIWAGQGRLAASDVRSLTDGLDRTKCPPPAPPPGLCLIEVKY